jgi:hypothetical protein
LLWGNIYKVSLPLVSPVSADSDETKLLRASLHTTIIITSGCKKNANWT